MSYLVLARKYRPQSFADVVGQDIIVQTLSKALNSGRIAHAFLFTGSRGVGKTTIARLLAKALACSQGISDSPCGKCSHCEEITNGTSIDVIEIDGASNTSVDDVRSLRESIRYQPSSCRFKIFIIDEVHMLSNSAFNALLKTLEEPPPHVKFIFATTESHKIPITILSRCQRYDFKRLDVETITKCLTQTLAKENITIDHEGLVLIAKSAEGGMRDALSLTDQVLSFSTESVTSEDVTKILGLMDRQNILHAVDALISGDVKTAISFIDKAINNGYDLNQFLNNVATELRHLTVASTLGSIGGFADLSSSEIAAIDMKAKNQPAPDLQRLFAMALDGIDQIAKTKKPHLMLELVFLRMALRPPMAEASTIAHAIAKLEHLSGLAKNLVNTPRSMPITVQPKSISTSTTIKSPVVLTQRDFENSWPQFVASIVNHMATVGHHLEHGLLIKSDKLNNKYVLTVSFNKELHFMCVDETKNDRDLQALIKNFYRADVVLNPVIASKHYETNLKSEIATLTISETNLLAEKKAQENLEQQAKEDPMVKRALAIFGGEIRAVKKIKNETSQNFN
ncbi:MAG: DNA polymerase III subunit gamma/tau [Proteobacteria bacterium]|nr:DNA polymerase III subunit gamma/tau [Pseudomonadota bacterium]